MGVCEKYTVKGLAKCGANKQQIVKYRKCKACCCSCKKACCICLSRVPIASLIASIIVGIGIFAFTFGLFKALRYMDTWLKLDELKTSSDFVVYFGIILATFSGLGLIIGCLATGRTRFNVCGAWGTRCVGRCCIFMLIAWHYLMWMIWTFMVPVFIAPVIFSVIVQAACSIHTAKQIGKTCIPFNKYAIDDIFTVKEVCGEELRQFCAAIYNATPYFGLCFAGTIFIVFGVVNMLLCLAANYAHIKDHRTRPKQSELSVARKCCYLEDPEEYFSTEDEDEAAEQLITLETKLKMHNEDFKVSKNGEIEQGWNYMSHHGSDEKLFIGKKV